MVVSAWAEISEEMRRIAANARQRIRKVLEKAIVVVLGKVMKKDNVIAAISAI